MGNSLLYGKAWDGSNIVPKGPESAAAIRVATAEGVGGFLDLFQGYGGCILPARYQIFCE